MTNRPTPGSGLFSPTWSEYGVQNIDENGKHRRWFRLGADPLEEVIARISEAKEKGYSVSITTIGERPPITTLMESEMYVDMTYETCRNRYEKSRNRILKAISTGKVSTSMSSIEYYHYAWDETPPKHWKDYLYNPLSWNGVTHLKVDAHAILSQLHPLSTAKNEVTS